MLKAKKNEEQDVSGNKGDKDIKDTRKIFRRNTFEENKENV